jgi:hypothetical protein
MSNYKDALIYSELNKNDATTKKIACCSGGKAKVKIPIPPDYDFSQVPSELAGTQQKMGYIEKEVTIPLNECSGMNDSSMCNNFVSGYCDELNQFYIRDVVTPSGIYNTNEFNVYAPMCKDRSQKYYDDYINSTPKTKFNPPELPAFPMVASETRQYDIPAVTTKYMQLLSQRVNGLISNGILISAMRCSNNMTQIKDSSITFDCLQISNVISDIANIIYVNLMQEMVTNFTHRVLDEINTNAENMMCISIYNFSKSSQKNQANIRNVITCSISKNLDIKLLENYVQMVPYSKSINQTVMKMGGSSITIVDLQSAIKLLTDFMQKSPVGSNIVSEIVTNLKLATVAGDINVGFTDKTHQFVSEPKAPPIPISNMNITSNVNELNTCQKNLESYKEQVSKLQNNRFDSTMIETYKKQIQDLQKQLDDLQKIPNSDNTELNTCQKNLESYKEQVSKLEKKTLDNSICEKQIQDLQKQLQDIQKTQTQCEKEKVILLKAQDELDKTNQTNSELTKKINELDTLSTKCETDKKSLIDQMALLNKKIIELNNINEICQKDKTKISDDVKKCESSISKYLLFLIILIILVCILCCVLCICLFSGNKPKSNVDVPIVKVSRLK